MDNLFEGLFYLAMISGAFSILGLIAEGIEWFCDAFDNWQKSTFANYADDDDFVAR